MLKEKLPIEEVKVTLSQAKSITILSHLNPDADTLGTALGIYCLLSKEKNKKVEIVNASNALPKYLDFLPYFNKIKYKMEYADSLIISCDCGSIDRLGFNLDNRKIINIDHHQSNTNYGTINVIVPEYASASQVAFSLFKPIYNIQADTATCFYTALLSDTRSFSTSSVNEKVFIAAQELVNLGANPSNITHNLTQRRSLSSLRILQKALNSLELKKNAQVAIMSVSNDDIRESGATVPDMEGIVDYAKSLVTIHIAIFAMELEDGIRISLRSKGIDVSKVAIELGGGGHKIAAGLTIKNSTLSQSIDTVLIQIDAFKLLDN